MKKVWLIWCLLIGFSAVVYAQPQHSAAGPVVKAKGLQHELKLTDEQTAKVAAIYKECAEECERIKRSEHGNSDKVAKSLRPLRAATIKKIESLLTSDQAAKFNVLVKQSKNGGVNDWGVLCY